MNSLDIALSRLKNAAYQEVYETKEKLQQVKNNYDKIFQFYEGNILKLDATQTKENIHHQIINYLEKQFV